MKNFVLGVMTISLGLVFLQGCTYDKEIAAPISACADTINVSFTTRVRPILESNCFSCHGNGENDGNISLDTHDKVKQVAISGRLLGAISHTQGFAPMPIGAAKLNNCNITAIRTWITEGSQNN